MDSNNNPNINHHRINNCYDNIQMKTGLIKFDKEFPPETLFIDLSNVKENFWFKAKIFGSVQKYLWGEE